MMQRNNANRISSYPHFKDVLKYQNIQFPITIKDVRKFEKHNNLAINLYCFERSKILPCSLSSQTHKADIKVINLYIYIYIHKTYTSAPPFYINTKRCDLIYDASTSVFGGHNVSYEIK
jgi:hypothetical protein